MENEYFNSEFADDSSDSTGLLFIKVYNSWYYEIKSVLKPLDITHPQFIVLSVAGYLEQSEKYITQMMISVHSDIDTVTLSQMIKLLLRKGLITRKEHPEDSRAKIIKLTKEGYHKMNAALPVVEAVDKKFFGKLKKEKTIFNKYLKKLIEI